MEREILIRTAEPAPDVYVDLLLVISPEEDYRVAYKLALRWLKGGLWSRDINTFACRDDAEWGFRLVVKELTETEGKTVFSVGRT